MAQKIKKEEEIQMDLAAEGSEVVAPVSAGVSEIPGIEVPVPEAPEAKAVTAAANEPPRNRRGRGDKRTFKRGSRREERTRSEFDQKMISIRRVARVVAGGRRFSFSVALVAGNRKGMVGLGVGKGGDTALAIEKAFRAAKRNMISVPLTKTNSIPHDIQVKYSSATILMMPARGRGLAAGGALRAVLELGGVHDVSAKILSRSKNNINIARAGLKALSSLSTVRRKNIQ